MNLSRHNFGLSGQPTGQYDHFICFSRKCKKRKQERHRARMERKKAKNDAQKAENERMRAETKLMQQTASPAAAAPVTTLPYTRQQMVTPAAIAPEGKADTPQKAGMGNGIIIIAAAVLLVGGYLYTQKKKNALPPVQATPLAA